MSKIKIYLVMVLVLLGLGNNLKAETLEINLATFATYASETNNINILIDDNLKNENIIFIINGSDSYFLESFKKAVALKGLELVQTDAFYFVRKKDIYLEEDKYRSIKLNFVKFEDIQNFLKVYEDKIKFEFISTSKTLLIKSKESEFESIYNMISSIDVLPKQLKLKVTILDTNLDKLKELGSDTSSINLQNNGNFFFNLVSYPFSVNNQVPTAQKDNFYTFLKYLNENGTSEFVSNPVLTLSDEKQTSFNVVSNLPFQMGTTTINDTAVRTSNSYEYKDVGLQITVTPHIYEDNQVYLDLELNVSNVVSNNDNLPVTSKKYIKQSFQLPVNKLLVLTGINKKELVTSNTEIPLLADIPFLGWLFKYESTELHKNNLSIVFELINEKDFDTKNFNVLVPNKIEG
jgi:general secretion pathway protein D